MPVTVKAIFENGQVKLKEPPPTAESVPVIVFFPDAEKSMKKNEIKFGSLKGKINVPSNFDDELDELKEYM